MLSLLIACGADTAVGADASVRSDATAPMDAVDAAAMTLDASAAADASPTDAAEPVEPPSLVSVQRVVHGDFALSWTLPAGGCTTITIHRNKDGAGYVVAQTVAGATTGANDLPGHAVGTYCYTVSCTQGGAMSAPSNERCASQ